MNMYRDFAVTSYVAHGNASLDGKQRKKRAYTHARCAIPYRTVMCCCLIPMSLLLSSFAGIRWNDQPGLVASPIHVAYGYVFKNHLPSMIGYTMKNNEQMKTLTTSKYC